MGIFRIMVADDHEVVRKGLVSLLQAQPDWQVCGEAGDGREAVDKATQLKPDVVILDIGMPSLNGLEATRQILKAAPATRVLILSAYSDDAYVEQVIAFGAAGYLVKQSEANVLRRAIREVYKGNTFFSPAIARRLEHRSGRGKWDRVDDQDHVTRVFNPCELRARVENPCYENARRREAFCHSARTHGRE